MRCGGTRAKSSGEEDNEDTLVPREKMRNQIETPATYSLQLVLATHTRKMKSAVVFWMCAACASAFVLSPAPTSSSVVMMVKRPQLKAAKKANRKRPKKSRPSDIYRKAPEYNVEPQYYEGRPDEFTVISEGDDDFDKYAHIKAVIERLEAAEPYDNTDADEEAKIIAAIKYPDPAFAAAAMSR